MPAYLVQLPSGTPVSSLGGASDSMVIFATDEAQARAAAAGKFSDAADELWLTLATVTEVVAGLNLPDAGDGWSAYVRISGAAAQTPDPIVIEVDGLDRNEAAGRLTAPRKHISFDNITIDAGGTGYSDDDIVTLVGGTFTRAATFRVTSPAGAVTALELVDPGEYTVLPNLVGTTDTTNDGTANDDVQLTLAQAEEGTYEALLAELVTELVNAGLTASVDLSENPTGLRILTLATVGDGIGDATVEIEFRQNGVADVELASTIVDGGVAAAVLTMAIPALPLAPARTTALKS